MMHHSINCTGEIGQLLMDGAEVTVPALPHVINKIQMDKGTA